MTNAVVPMLTYEDARAALAWLADAFGFREQTDQRYENEDGSIGHAQLEAGGGLIMLASGSGGYESPRRHRETCESAARWSKVPWVIDGVLVEVDDVGSHFARARAAGARLLSELEEHPYGRLYRVEDLEGHRWMFIQP
jgi:PhnB protein